MDDKRQARGLAVLAPSGFAVLAGWWTPRGPMSAVEGLTAMGLGLLVGLAAGLLLRSRWAMLVAPDAFVAVFELGGPELYSAFTGAGQMVSPTETDRVFYRDTVTWARDNGDTGLAGTLTENGPPPYTRMLD